MTSIFANPSEILESNKEQMFVDFQKNNKPSGIGYIQKHSVPYFFEAIQDDILASMDDTKIVVKRLEAEVVDETGDVASVHYAAEVVTNGESEFIDEVWHFKYTGWGWKLCGIEQI